MALSNQLLQQVSNLVQNKLDQVENKLRAICKRKDVAKLLKELENFFGIKLELQLVPKEKGIAQTSQPSVNTPVEKSSGSENKSDKKGGARKMSGSYTAFFNAIKEALPVVVKKLGKRKKKFTSGDVVDALKEAGVPEFKKKWMSLVLSPKRISGVNKIGTIRPKGKQLMNVYQLDGKPVEIVKKFAGNKKTSKKRKRSRTKSKNASSKTSSFAALCDAMPNVVSSLGESDKEFTSPDVASALTKTGFTGFQPEWVTLALSSGRVSGVKKVGTTQPQGRRKMNLYKLNGEPVQSVQSGASQKS